MTKKVPFFNYQQLYKSQKEDFLRILDDVLGRGAYILQNDLKEFENNLAEYTGAKHAIGVANGTDALEMIYEFSGLKTGDEVIYPSHTFIASPASIHYIGAVPVPVDCGPDHMLDAKSVEQAITPKTRAIMPVQLNGRTCNMDELQSLADKHNLLIIEDSAQGLGSKFKNKMAGTFGLAGTYSFYPAKILGCFGDGGAIVTNDSTLAEKLMWVRDHGRNPQSGVVEVWGRNSRLDNVQAALLNFQFRFFKDTIQRRRKIASLYTEQLGSLAQITLPPAPDTDPNHFDTYQNYEIEAQDRDGLKKFLGENGIGTLVQWGGTATHQMKNLGFTQQLPSTDALFTRLLMLPMNTLLSDDDVLYVCQKIQQFYSA